MISNILGLGFLGIAAYAVLKSDKSIPKKSNPKKKKNPSPKRWKHSIPDKYLPMVLSSLAYLKSYPEKSENIPDNIITLLIKEKWYDPVRMEVSDLGAEFLLWAGSGDEDGETVPDED